MSPHTTYQDPLHGEPRIWKRKEKWDVMPGPPYLSELLPESASSHAYRRLAPSPGTALPSAGPSWAPSEKTEWWLWPPDPWIPASSHSWNTSSSANHLKHRTKSRGAEVCTIGFGTNLPVRKALNKPWLFISFNNLTSLLLWFSSLDY